MCELEKYLVIPADISKPCYFVELDDHSFFNRLVYSTINCDCYERVQIYRGLDVSFLVGETGKLKDPPKDFNLRASMFYDGAACGDPLVGDVFVCDICLVDGEYDFCPISEEKELRILRNIDLIEKLYKEEMTNG